MSRRFWRGYLLAEVAAKHVPGSYLNCICMSFSDSLLVPFFLLLQGETGPRQGTREAVATQQNALRERTTDRVAVVVPKIAVAG